MGAVKEKPPLGVTVGPVRPLPAFLRSCVRAQDVVAGKNSPWCHDGFLHKMLVTEVAPGEGGRRAGTPDTGGCMQGTRSAGMQACRITEKFSIRTCVGAFVNTGTPAWGLTIRPRTQQLKWISGLFTKS